MQPTLHDKRIVLVAPTQVITGRDGWILNDAEGVYHADVRAISHLSLAMDARIDCIATHIETARTLAQRFIVRGVGEEGPDPELILTRTLRVRPGTVEDEYSFNNVGSQHLSFHVGVNIGSDLARMDSVKTGRNTEVIAPVIEETADEQILTWEDEALRVRAIVPALAGAPRRMEIEPGGTASLKVDIALTEHRSPLFTAPARPAEYLPELTVTVDNASFRHTLTRSLDDLRSLLLIDSEAPTDAFLAAGAPWYFTLFGRDSLWAAQFLLPLGTKLAMGTLRTLARRQATSVDPRSQAEPGKILHEMRAESIDLGNGVTLPPIYYGSIDSTALWVSLLHSAWKHGASDDEVLALLPNLDAALNWIEGATSRDGFLRYIDSTGSGLANQGWKDSADGVRHLDGTLGEAPIALCEVQAYAYAAARGATELQRYFGVGDPDRWEEFAAALADRFRDKFWVDSTLGAQPAIALDRNMKPVSALTSNIGHLLGTGICNREEAAQIAKLLMSEELNSGYGLRTMGTSTSGFNPLGYHTGSVWSHDTMIAARGLSKEGFHLEAVKLAAGILDAAAEFDGRLPELHGGYSSKEGRPAAYAASCRPQAWAAASVVEALRIFLNLNLHAPHGWLEFGRRAPDILAGLRLDGLWAGDHPVSVSVDGDLVINVQAPGIKARIAPELDTITAGSSSQ